MEVRYSLEPLIVDPYETVVRAERERTEVSRISLHGQELREVPGTMGDPFRVVMLMPGVAAIASGVSYPVVRGSQPAATGFFVDGVRVPALFHAALGPSVIHPDFIDGLDFHAGAPPVRFGRLLSGAVEGHVRRPREEGLHATAYADLVNAGAFMEKAFPESGTSVSVAGRFSYSGWLAGRLGGALTGGREGSQSPVADFADYQARIEQRVGPGRLRLLALGSSDVLGMRSETTSSPLVHSNFHRADVRWQQPLAGGELEAGLTWGLQNAGLEVLTGKVVDATFGLRESTYAARLQWTLPISAQLTLSAGADASHQRSDSSLFAGVAADPSDPAGEGDGFRVDRALGTFTGAWLQAIWRPVPGLMVVPGLRLDGYHLFGNDTLAALDPRLTVRHALTDSVTLKGGAALLHQAPTVLLPLPLVDVAGLAYGLQESAQVDVGAEWAVMPGMEVGVDAYVTRLTRAVEFDPMDLYRGRRQAISGYEPGTEGRAWGVELMVRHPLGQNWFGWISYAYQRSDRWERFLRLDDDLSVLGAAEGWVPFAFEQQHVFNAAVGWQLPGNWSLGTNLHFNTGRPESGRLSSRTHRMVTDASTGKEGWTIVDRDRADRLPSFFRLDLRVSKKWIYDAWALELYLDLMNATASTEVLGFNYTSGDSGPFIPGRPAPDTGLQKQSFGFPVILPMLGVKGTY